MKSVGVVGAGTMGSGIAQIAAAAGFETLLHDISPSLIERGRGLISAGLERGVLKGRMTRAVADAVLARVRGAETLEDLGRCDIVIEAAAEDRAIKVEIFRRLSAATPEPPDGRILATNTSSLSVTALASSVSAPARFVGLHFFNPAPVMKLVEVVRGHRTSDETVRAVTAFAERLGKVVVVAADSPGFIVNRVARPFYGEALKLLGEGVAQVGEIDRIVKAVGGFRMGPFELMDLIGIDVNFTVTKSVYEQTFGEPRFRPHVIQERMVNAGLLGRKTGRGFYDYRK
jgi:3-hydroxybutyryl-CoA dehydrogenase